MSSNFTVVYDACVLYPAPLRDLLMQLALTDMFRARWTNQIHEEWIRNVVKDRPDLSKERLFLVRDLMNSHVRDCLICDYEDLIPSIHLPDEDDRHVLAAAIKGNADLIVTFNLKDFPDDVVSKYNIECKNPDDFICDQIDLSSRVVLQAVRKCQERLKNPPFSIEQYLETLLKQGLSVTVSMLRELYPEG